MFSGYFLRVTGKLRTFPVSSIVYCFVDEGFQFRVCSDHLVNGVREVIFDHCDRHKFEIIS